MSRNSVKKHNAKRKKANYKPSKKVKKEKPEEKLRDPHLSKLFSEGFWQNLYDIKLGNTSELPLLNGKFRRGFLLHRRALLHRFSAGVNSGCTSPIELEALTQRFGSLGQRKTFVKYTDYFRNWFYSATLTC